jgi:small-conductance mechanosensitive channel
VTFWGVGLLGFALALNLVGLRAVASGLQAGGGITAVVLGFAFREIGENLLAGFLLAFSRPFKVNDII